MWRNLHQRYIRKILEFLVISYIDIKIICDLQKYCILLQNFYGTAVSTLLINYEIPSHSTYIPNIMIEDQFLYVYVIFAIGCTQHKFSHL